MPEYRAQCASCMRVNEDPAAEDPAAGKCPACGSRRLVVLCGARERQRIVVPLKPPAQPDPREAKAAPVAHPEPITNSGPPMPKLSPPTPRRADIAGAKGGRATQSRLRRRKSGWGPALREVIAAGCGALNMSDADMARELCVSRERVRQVRRALGKIPTKAQREAAAAERRQKQDRRPVRIMATPASRLDDLPLPLFRALSESSHPEICRNADGSLSAPLEVALAALGATGGR